jgi:hypothetical protein
MTAAKSQVIEFPALTSIVMEQWFRFFSATPQKGVDPDHLR